MTRLFRPTLALSLLAASSLSLLTACDDGNGNAEDPPQTFVEPTCHVGATEFAFSLETPEGSYASEANGDAVSGLAYDTTIHRDWLGNPGSAQHFTGVLSFNDTPILAPYGHQMANEPVSLWTFDHDASRWIQLGSTVTDESGAYRFDLDTPFPEGTWRTWAVFESARRCYEHNAFVWPKGTQVVLADIDGTLSSADSELHRELNGEPDYDQQRKIGAERLMNEWASKGYGIIYLTARPHNFRVLTEAWLERHGFPLGASITQNSITHGQPTRHYKGAEVTHLRENLGWEFVSMYGNADTDYQGYMDAGVSADLIYIIGEHAGEAGTQPIENDDYTSHIDSFVVPYPAAERPAPAAR